jgi:hypothetical protein
MANGLGRAGDENSVKNRDEELPSKQEQIGRMRLIERVNKSRESGRI